MIYRFTTRPIQTLAGFSPGSLKLGLKFRELQRTTLAKTVLKKNRIRRLLYWKTKLNKDKLVMTVFLLVQGS